jgi:hypothetical protein
MSKRIQHYKRMTQADLKKIRKTKEDHQKYLHTQEITGKKELKTGLAQLTYMGHGCKSSLRVPLVKLRNNTNSPC